MAHFQHLSAQGERSQGDVFGRHVDEKRGQEEALQVALFRGFFFFLDKREQENIFVKAGKFVRERNLNPLMQGAFLHVMKEIMNPADELVCEMVHEAASLPHASETLRVMFKVFGNSYPHLPRDRNKIRLVSCLLQNAESNCFYLEKLLLSEQPPPIFEEDILHAATGLQNPVLFSVLLFHYSGSLPKGLVRRVVAAKQWCNLRILITDTSLSRNAHFEDEWTEAFDQALFERQDAFLHTFLSSSLGRRLKKERLSLLISSSSSRLVEVAVGRTLWQFISEPVRFQEILWAVSKKGHRSSADLLVKKFPATFQASPAFPPIGWKKLLFACLLLVGQPGGPFELLQKKVDFCFELALQGLTFFDLALVGGQVHSLQRILDSEGDARAQQHIHSLLKTQAQQAKLPTTFLWMVARDSHESFEFAFLLCAAPAETWVSLARRVIDRALITNAPKTCLWACCLMVTYGEEIENVFFFQSLVSSCLRRPRSFWALEMFCKKISANIKTWGWDFLVPLFSKLWSENAFVGEGSRRHFIEVVEMLGRHKIAPLELRFRDKRLLQELSSVPNENDREFFCLSFLQAHKSHNTTLPPFVRENVEDFVLTELGRNHPLLAWKILEALPKDEACLIILRGPIFYSACHLGEAGFMQKLLVLTSSKLSEVALCKLMMSVCQHPSEVSAETDEKKTTTLAHLTGEWRLRHHEENPLLEASELMQEAARSGCWRVLEFISKNDLFTFNLPCGDLLCKLESPAADRPLVHQSLCRNLTDRLSTKLILFFASLPRPHFDLAQFDFLIEIVIQYCLP